MQTRGWEFMWNPHHGYITTCPTNIGTGLRAGVHLRLKYLAKVVHNDDDDVCMAWITMTEMLILHHWYFKLWHCVIVLRTATISRHGMHVSANLSHIIGFPLKAPLPYPLWCGPLQFNPQWQLIYCLLICRGDLLVLSYLCLDGLLFVMVKWCRRLNCHFYFQMTSMWHVSESFAFLVEDNIIALTIVCEHRI